jgi:hypothetical protein
VFPELSIQGTLSALKNTHHMIAGKQTPYTLKKRFKLSSLTSTFIT